MRIVLILIAGALLLVEWGRFARPLGPRGIVPSATVATAATRATAKERVDFDTQLKPIFKARCMPCHFSGGQMYERLPFDKPETIRKLGAKLFTRIKQEDERRLIEDFLSQAP